MSIAQSLTFHLKTFEQIIPPTQDQYPCIFNTQKLIRVALGLQWLLEEQTMICIQSQLS